MHTENIGHCTTVYEYAHTPASITQIVDRVRFKNVKLYDRVM